MCIDILIDTGIERKNRRPDKTINNKRNGLIQFYLHYLFVIV